MFSLTDRMKLLAGGRYDVAYQSALNLKGGGGRFSEKLNDAFTIPFFQPAGAV